MDMGVSCRDLKPSWCCKLLLMRRGAASLQQPGALRGGCEVMNRPPIGALGVPGGWAAQAGGGWRNKASPLAWLLRSAPWWGLRRLHAQATSPPLNQTCVVLHTACAVFFSFLFPPPLAWPLRSAPWWGRAAYSAAAGPAGGTRPWKWKRGVRGAGE